MSNCPICGRTLKNDSRYCDYCGSKLPENQNPEPEEQVLDKTLLTKWILISIFITAGITLISQGIGIPILFGGLFLPFFFKRKKK